MRKGFELAITLCVMNMTACGPTFTNSHKLNISAPKHIADDLVLLTNGDTPSPARFSSASDGIQTASVLAGELRIENEQVLWHLDDVTTPVGIIDEEEIRLCQDAQIFDCEVMISVKPGDTSRDKPLVSLHMRKTSNELHDEDTSFPGESTLIRHTLPSPNQDEAGTCLFMATTGAAEIILNQKGGRPIAKAR